APVTVTNPTRGSCSSFEMTSLRTARIASSTRRIRAPAIVSLRNRASASGELALDLPRGVRLHDVAFLHVGVIPQHDAAVVAARNLASVLVEAPQRKDLAVIDDRA